MLVKNVESANAERVRVRAVGIGVNPDLEGGGEGVALSWFFEKLKFISGCKCLEQHQQVVDSTGGTRTTMMMSWMTTLLVSSNQE